MDLSNLGGGTAGGGQRPPQQGGQRVNVNLNDLQDIECEECENDTFQEALFLKRMSPLVSPNGQGGIVPVQVFFCTQCGHVNEEFRPEGI